VSRGFLLRLHDQITHVFLQETDHVA